MAGAAAAVSGSAVSGASSSGAELASASGKWTSNVVPVPGSLRARMKPPLCLVIPYAEARPRPEPFPGPFVVKNGSKTCASVSGSMPSPVSETETTT